MTTLEYHVLLAMAGGPLYGYAIKQAVESESAGTLTPRAGSLYRVIARLIAQGRARAAAPKDTTPHPGLARRYYALTPEGRSALAAEAHRLKGVAALARKRLGIAGGRS